MRGNELDPVQLAFDRAGNLIVVSYAGNGTVYSFKLDAPGLDATLLKSAGDRARRSPIGEGPCRTATAGLS